MSGSAPLECGRCTLSRQWPESAVNDVNIGIDYKQKLIKIESCHSPGKVSCFQWLEDPDSGC